LIPRLYPSAEGNALDDAAAILSAKLPKSNDFVAGSNFGVLIETDGSFGRLSGMDDNEDSRYFRT